MDKMVPSYNTRGINSNKQKKKSFNVYNWREFNLCISEMPGMWAPVTKAIWWVCERECIGLIGTYSDSDQFCNHLKHGSLP